MKNCPFNQQPCQGGTCQMWVPRKLDKDGVTVLEPGYCALAKA